MTATLRVTWPIENPLAPITQMKAEALADLAGTGKREGFQFVGNVGWHLQHGERPSLIATVKVTT